MNRLICILLIFFSIIVLINVICAVIYFRRKAGSGNICINIPSTPNNKCLASCDTVSDQCYDACQGDSDCIGKCYQDKGFCYVQCLGAQTEQFCPSKEDCGCGS